MAKNLYVILTESLTGNPPLVFGDQYVVGSKKEGERLIAAGIAKWPESELIDDSTSNSGIDEETKDAGDASSAEPVTASN